MFAWTAKSHATRAAGPMIMSAVTAAADSAAARRRYTAVQGRRAGATTAVAGTADGISAGIPGIAGRSGMSRGIGGVGGIGGVWAVMPSP
ncbi:hypothetical protein GCM10010508_10400 [Streptomyces naganishii JCM 4654]|uniref:Uncharacterized protein n=1 Tax=Streptomyces naganishii JCM 4654 TaxID=1306179 RepID=A0A918Y0W7_9ACTN|nr:hypothetical protein GCM10010508_10400 [Streptomyces naganishii JCM 4654]